MDRATHGECVGENPRDRDNPRLSSFPINLALTCANMGHPSQLSSPRLPIYLLEESFRKEATTKLRESPDWIFALTLTKPKSELQNICRLLRERALRVFNGSEFSDADRHRRAA